MKKILIAEDDNNINEMICTALSKAGYTCISAYSGTECMLRLSGERFELVVLDLMLPGLTGQEVLRQLREKSDLPVIVLSAKDELDTKVSLLRLGANDYMTKPFELKELEARVQVQLRNLKGNMDEHEIICYRELEYDAQKKRIAIRGQTLELTAQEFRILERLVHHPGKIFSKNEIYEYAWNDYYMGEDKTIHVHISNIRQKIKKITEEEYIKTVWGLGFKLA